MKENPPTPTPLWLLEKVALSELPAPLPQATAERLSSADLSAERRALSEADADFFRRYPPEQIVPQIRSRAHKARLASRRRAQWAAGSLAFAAAACAALFLVLPKSDRGLEGGAELEDARVKGSGPALFVFRQSVGQASPSPLKDRTAVRAGDVLQLSYVAAGRVYGAIISIDGAQKVTLHLPRDTAASATLEPSGEVFLPYGYRLDAAPRFERFVLVTSRTPFSVDEVVAAARAVARSPSPADSPLPLPKTFGQASRTVLKDAP